MAAVALQTVPVMEAETRLRAGTENRRASRDGKPELSSPVVRHSRSQSASVDNFAALADNGHSDESVPPRQAVQVRGETGSCFAD
jgi:hypothetical protein